MSEETRIEPGRLGARDVLAAAGLLALVLLLCAPVVRLGWTWDDPFQLRFTESHAPLGYAFDPEVWAELRKPLLTPLLFASYDLDLALFGRWAPGFYGHQLAALWLAALGLHLALRPWLPVVPAAAAGMLFLLGPPTVSWAQELMVRHYLEGMALAALSLLLFVRRLRRGRGAPAWGSAAAYLAACAAKEVYVPLVVLLAALPEGRWRDRLHALAPHGAVVVLYVLWRWWMLGGVVESPGWVVTPAELPRLALELPRAVAAAVAGEAAVWGVLLLASVGSFGLAGAVVSPAARRLLPLGLFLVLAPLLPVAHDVQDRYAVLPWVVLVVAAVFVAWILGQRVRRPSRTIGLTTALALVLAFGALAHRGEWAAGYRLQERMSEEARFYLEELGREDRLAWPATPAASLDELDRWRRGLGRPAAAGWFQDDLFLCLHPELPGRTFTWGDPQGRMVDVTGQLARRRRSFCSSIRGDAPLEAALTHREGTLFWRLGPWRQGGWFFVLGDGRTRWPVPREDGFALGGEGGVALRVRYDSPEGWVTYSPPLALDFERASTLTWRRGGEPGHGR